MTQLCHQHAVNRGLSMGGFRVGETIKIVYPERCKMCKEEKRLLIFKGLD